MNGNRIHAFILALVVASSAAAMDTPKPDPKEPEKKSELDAGRAAIARQDWAGAQAALRDAVARHPENADAHNLYAYSMRKGDSPQMDLVFRHYNEALRLNPQHVAAREYLGEAYLMSGNLAKAEEHLALLGRICLIPCDEYGLLRDKIAAFRAKQR